MINGLINVYKERGYTSMDVCAVMRGISGQRKVGHTGTLDPDAEGVLPVCLGNATKLCDMLTDKEKEYVASFVLGKKTDTLDIWGTVLEEREPKAFKDAVIESIKSFIGGYNQLPPLYSAKKINGHKLCDLARSGREIKVERKPVWVDIRDIEILNVNYPEFTIKVTCGKGTYIRSLCEDIGSRINELSTMTSLKRTRVSDFKIEEAFTLDALTNLKNEGALLSAVKPTDFVFSEYKSIKVKKEYRKIIDNGNKLSLSFTDFGEMPIDSEKFRVYNNEGEFTGVYFFDAKENSLKPFKMFFEVK